MKRIRIGQSKWQTMKTQRTSIKLAKIMIENGTEVAWGTAKINSYENNDCDSATKTWVGKEEH